LQRRRSEVAVDETVDVLAESKPQQQVALGTEAIVRAYSSLPSSDAAP